MGVEKSQFAGLLECIEYLGEFKRFSPGDENQAKWIKFIHLLSRRSDKQNENSINIKPRRDCGVMKKKALALPNVGNLFQVQDLIGALNPEQTKLGISHPCRYIHFLDNKQYDKNLKRFQEYIKEKTMRPLSSNIRSTRNGVTRSLLYNPVEVIIK